MFRSKVYYISDRQEIRQMHAQIRHQTAGIYVLVVCGLYLLGRLRNDEIRIRKLEKDKGACVCNAAESNKQE